MTLTQLLYFKELARIQHLTHTAEILHISQPSLSNSINALEKELGTKLFTRKGRNITLNEQGAAFFLCVDQIFETLSSGVEALQASSAQGNSTVKVGFTSSLSFTAIPYLLKDFSSSGHDNITVSLKYYENNRNMVESILSDELHMGLGFSVEKPLICIPLIKEELVFVLPISHPLAHAEKLSLFDVKDEPILMSSREAYMFSHISNMYSYCDLTPVPFITDDNHMTRSCHVAMGACIAISCRRRVPTANTVEVAIDHPMNFREVYLCWKQSQTATPGLDTVREYMIRNSKLLNTYNQI